jgi:hypothetical protein
MRFLIALLALSAFAADISGNWKGTADTPNGKFERTFTFRVVGTKVTGETNSQLFGKSMITDGRIEGDDLTFSISVKFQDNEMKVNYKGRVNPEGNEIKFTAEAQDGGLTVEYVAKRLS